MQLYATFAGHLHWTRQGQITKLEQLTSMLEKARLLADRETTSRCVVTIAHVMGYGLGSSRLSDACGKHSSVGPRLHAQSAPAENAGRSVASLDYCMDLCSNC